MARRVEGVTPHGALRLLRYAKKNSRRLANEDMTGRDGHHVPALPRDRVAALFRDGPG